MGSVQAGSVWRTPWLPAHSLLLSCPTSRAEAEGYFPHFVFLCCWSWCYSWLCRAQVSQAVMSGRARALGIPSGSSAWQMVPVHMAKQKVPGAAQGFALQGFRLWFCLCSSAQQLMAHRAPVSLEICVYKAGRQGLWWKEL